MKKSKSPQLYCVNCLHCKEFTHVSRLTGARERKVKCAAGQWATASGKQKIYSLYTVLSRRKNKCAHYDSMGETDLGEFISTLRETLPVERIVEYPPDAQRKSA